MSLSLLRGMRVKSDSTSTVTINGAEEIVVRPGLCMSWCVTESEDVAIVLNCFSCVWRWGRSFLESLCVRDGVSHIIGRVLGIRKGVFHAVGGLWSFGSRNR